MRACTGMNTDQLVEMAEADKDILAAILFGSSARGKVYRDIDICLVTDPTRHVNLARKDLAYLARFYFDIHTFPELPVRIRMRVLEEGKCLLSKDGDALYDIAHKTVQEFEDFKLRYEDYLEEILHG